jgi:hypothetical protein
MSVTLQGVQIGRASWWRRFRARLRPAPSRPPTYHATRTANVRPGAGGRHRPAVGGVIRQEALPNGWIVTFRRRP